MSRGKAITMMEAREARRLRRMGLNYAQIGARLGRDKGAIHRACHDKGMQEQHAIADRMEYFLGGAAGPGSGNYRSHAVHRDDGNSRVLHDLGVHELSAADPLDILIAEEEANGF